jgi:hypothetical protein
MTPALCSGGGQNIPAPLGWVFVDHCRFLITVYWLHTYIEMWQQFVGYCLSPCVNRTLFAARRPPTLSLLAEAVTPAARGINFESYLLHDMLLRNLLHCVRASCRHKNGRARSVSMSVLCAALHCSNGQRAPHCEEHMSTPVKV